MDFPNVHEVKTGERVYQAISYVAATLLVKQLLEGGSRT